MGADITETRYKLNTGADFPAIGLGTWQSGPGEVAKAVAHAVKSGYRHIDGALCYQNEKEVGEGLKEAFAAGVKREDVFVTTKLWCSYHQRVEEGIDQSLKDLGLDYVDLYLVHWPVPLNAHGNHPLFPKKEDGSRDIVQDWTHIDTWKSMEKLLDTGKVKAIGVSNYSVKYLEELLKEAKVVPAVNQIENHPLLPQQEIIDFCKAKGIVVTAYSPFGSTGTPIMEAAPIKKVAEKHGVSPATVLISWHLARGSAVIPKSVTPARIESNHKAVALDEEDMATIAKYTDDEWKKNGGPTRFVYPPWGIPLGFPDKDN
ncbi:protein GCY [Ascosphaera apis ARSEF 7405]|uniref:D-xylose reductase [NAD(P)H] n=1 Tax=Ascosphaera apis ARSEF 7405 TaxID=392613 RepID=A0A162IIK8_9EURO|nr:protein GCY [Ascosphaera apis ARSEF 7405]